MRVTNTTDQFQEMGPTASQLDVYQRTPNLALPMGKRDLSKEEQDALKPLYPRIHALRELCFAGFDYDLLERDTVSPFFPCNNTMC
jgi:hypothetical protein